MISAGFRAFGDTISFGRFRTGNEGASVQSESASEESGPAPARRETDPTGARRFWRGQAHSNAANRSWDAAARESRTRRADLRSQGDSPGWVLEIGCVAKPDGAGTE